MSATCVILYGYVMENVYMSKKFCTYFDSGWCCHKDGPNNGCIGWGKCEYFKEKHR